MPESPPSDPKQAIARPKTSPGELRILASGLFFTGNSPVPSGIRARDMSAMVQGLVDEHSPMPIEQTSWGFVLDNRRKQQSHFLYYAAPQSLLFKNTAEASDLGLEAVIPGFVATCGLHFKEPTWLFLTEAECLSAVRFEAGSTAPDKVVSRFVGKADSDESARFALREELDASEGEASVGGLVRIASAKAKKGKGLTFELEQCEAPGAAWRTWKKTELRPHTRVLAADLRRHEVLAGQMHRKSSGQRILQFAAVFILLLAALGALEFFQIQRKAEAERLAAQAESQEDAVERLQEIESMTKSLNSVLEKKFEPYRWMMAVNADRPETLSLSSFAFDDAGEMQANGEAPQVQALNDYVASLQANPKFESVSITNLTTNREGVSFNLRIQTGDLDAESPPPEPPPAETVDSPTPTTDAAPDEKADAPGEAPTT
jgi:hypothetical protein